MWAVSADIIFKQIFGRVGPNSGYLEYHHYGFHPLHAGLERAAFPSGTAAISAAMVSVLWLVYPRSRLVGLIIVVLLCAMVVIMNYHWLSDTIAGAFLGTFIGCSTVRLHAIKVDCE
jgi:membrane-associated phospholipid phosphatase